MDEPYLLIRQTPFKVVTAHRNLFEDAADAASAVADTLRNYTSMTRGAAEQDGREFAKLAVGEIFEHPSGYRFRLIPANFTDNGKPITPGLRVLNNDLRQGTVCRAQFMQTGDLKPGGQLFIGWYDVDVDGGGRTSFDGGRLTTDGSAFGIDVSRETSFPDDPDNWTGRTLDRARLLDNMPVVHTDGSPG